jgi:hypothetical protein
MVARLDDSRDSNLSETSPGSKRRTGVFFSPAGEPQKSASVAQPSIKQSASAERRPASELEESSLLATGCSALMPRGRTSHRSGPTGKSRRVNLPTTEGRSPKRV